MKAQQNNVHNKRTQVQIEQVVCFTTGWQAAEKHTVQGGRGRAKSRLYFEKQTWLSGSFFFTLPQSQRKTRKNTEN